MDIATARTTIQSSFDTAWNSETPIVWDNVEYDSDNSEFVRCTVDYDDGWQASLGGITNRLFRNKGFVFIQIFTSQNQSASRNDALAQIAYDYFVTPLSGIRFYNPKVKKVGQDGNYYQQNVIVEFEFDQQK